jgi:anti-sigma factor RsiW
MSDHDAPRSGRETAGTAGGVPPDDLLLTAYLDGELDDASRATLEERLKNEPGLAARLASLRRGTNGLGAAFEAMKTVAPQPRLTEILEAARAGARQRPPRRAFRFAPAIAAALAIFVAGAVAGWILLPPGGHDEHNWREEVAEYQRFTTTDTLAAIPDAPDLIAAELKTISAKLAVPLTPANLALTGATLKRVDLFAFDGRPLAQLAYLTESQGPVAFCIVPAKKPDAPVQFEVRHGFNIVYWTDDGRAYLLIGKAGRATLEGFAATLAAKV